MEWRMGSRNFRALSLVINMFFDLSLRQTVHWFDNGGES
jgi:hypothetical protein